MAKDPSASINKSVPPKADAFIDINAELARMKKATKVKWTTSSGVHGQGETITDSSNGHILVAVDAQPGQEHRVIYCAVTWLTAI
jgi:hypothetical protein